MRPLSSNDSSSPSPSSRYSNGDRRHRRSSQTSYTAPMIIPYSYGFARLVSGPKYSYNQSFLDDLIAYCGESFRKVIPEHYTLSEATPTAYVSRLRLLSSHLKH
ncbi:hypothetical protein GEMRC1_008900 [Eukaryota sp. GEM-RC1]